MHLTHFWRVWSFMLQHNFKFHAGCSPTDGMLMNRIQNHSQSQLRCGLGLATLRSLRRSQEDRGWVKTLYSQASSRRSRSTGLINFSQSCVPLGTMRNTCSAATIPSAYDRLVLLMVVMKREPPGCREEKSRGKANHFHLHSLIFHLFLYSFIHSFISGEKYCFVCQNTPQRPFTWGV